MPEPIARAPTIRPYCADRPGNNHSPLLRGAIARGITIRPYCAGE